MLATGSRQLNCYRKSEMMTEMILTKIQTVLGRIWKDIKAFRAAIFFFAVYNVAARTLFGAFCPQLILTVFPCAGCGMTRAVFCVLTGQFARGMRLNPAAPAWVIFLCWFFWNRYIRGTHQKNTYLWLGIVCAVTLAVYLYRMINCFPGNPPMVYFRNNILRRICNTF